MTNMDPYGLPILTVLILVTGLALAVLTVKQVAFTNDIDPEVERLHQIQLLEDKAKTIPEINGRPDTFLVVFQLFCILTDNFSAFGSIIP